MLFWKVRSQPLSGHKYEEVIREAEPYIKLYRKNGPKRPFIRSPLFKKRKVFLDYFWDHLFSKPLNQRKHRLKLLPCGFELISNTTLKPELNRSTTSSELFFRCYGKLKSGQCFVVQIKETKKQALQLMSMFYWDRK